MTWRELFYGVLAMACLSIAVEFFGALAGLWSVSLREATALAGLGGLYAGLDSINNLLDARRKKLRRML